MQYNYLGEPRCQFFIWEDIFQSVVRENVNKTRENELRKREDALLLREYEAQKEKDRLLDREHMVNKQEGELGRRILENRIGRILLCIFWILSLVKSWF
ncbi:hypothetical protein I3760_04G119500 [Carya illinoinensis]|nr:hypothetical protein I3760_04G119500 [Carya illinoinensis]